MNKKRNIIKIQIKPQVKPNKNTGHELKQKIQELKTNKTEAKK